MPYSYEYWGRVWLDAYHEQIQSLPTPTYVYRHYDKNKLLLYVGITIDLESRTKTHKRKSVWWKEIDKIIYEYFSSKMEAEIAERKIISAENPKYNKR